MSTEREDPIVEQEMRFHCDNGHRWRESWLMPMDMLAFSRRMSASAKCPSCGSTSYLGWTSAEASKQNEAAA